MSNSDELRLAVLSAIIAQHGPIPCISVKLIHGLSALSDSLHYRLVETQITHRIADGAVILANSPFAGLPEPTAFSGRVHANHRRDLLCELLIRLPMPPTICDRALMPDMVNAVMRGIQAGPDGVTILQPRYL